MRKIVFIRSRYPDVRMNKEATTLACHGYKVTVLGWERWVVSREDKQDYEVRKLKVRVPPDSLRVALWLPLWWLFVLYRLLLTPWDAVHAIDFDSFVPAVLASKVLRRPVIYDIGDFYADVMRFPILPTLSRKITANVDRKLMRLADIVVLPDESRIEQVGVDTARRPVIIINNSPDPSLMVGLHGSDSDSSGFSVFYGGGVKKERGLMEVCLSVRTLSDVRLTIMGYCPPSFDAELRELCRDSKNISLHLEWVTYEEIIRETAKAQLLFGLYDPRIPNNRYASPNKLFEAMMCGKPIIVSDGSSMADIVRRENCGLVVPYGDVAEIREAILKLKNDSQLRETLGQNGRKAYEDSYSWRIMGQRLLDSYQHLADKLSKRLASDKSRAQ